MKKKLFLTIGTLFVTCAALIGITKPVEVNAVTAKAPTNIPNKNDVLYAILDEPFDYGTYISFDGVKAKDDMKKIILTTNAGIQIPLEDKDDSWFSVYCLDGSLKYPEFSIVNAGEIEGDTYGVKALLRMALFNDKELYNVFEKAAGYKIGPDIEYTLPDGYTDETLVKAIKDEEVESITVNVSKLTYTKSIDDDTTLVITAEELSKTTGQTTYPVTLKKSEIMFDKYTSEVMSGENYAHALWILEHSYPTFTLEESLEMAGADFDKTVAELLAVQGFQDENNVETVENAIKTIKACTAKDEIATLYRVTPEEVTTDMCTARYNEIVGASSIENFVYSTVQYAIWKATGGAIQSGEAIGNKLDQSEELDKLYQYLIKNRAEYNGYLNFQFNSELKLTKPQNGKEIFKETDTHFVYGPYTVGYDMLSIKEATVALEGAPAGAEIVDEAGNAVTTLQPNQKFYVKAEKAKKITNLKIKLNAENAITFESNDDRGRIYYSYYPLSQNVISGGKYITKDSQNVVELVFNPKTGYENNTALLFVVTLIGFSLGYVALIMKNKTVELN